MARKLTQDQNARLNGLAQAETAGTITDEQKIVLDEFRARGQFPKTGSVYMESSAPPTAAQLLGRLGFDIGGGLTGRKLATKLATKHPLGKIGLALAEGLGSGLADIPGQVVSEGRSLEDVSLKESALSFGAPPLFAGVGKALKAPGEALSNWFFKKVGRDVKAPEVTERVIKRTEDAQTPLPVQSLLRSNFISIAYAIAREAPFAGGLIRKGEESIAAVYERDIRAFIAQYQSAATKLESGEMIKQLLQDAAGVITNIKGKSVDTIRAALPQLTLDLTQWGGKAGSSIDDVVALSEKIEGKELSKLKFHVLDEIGDEISVLKDFPVTMDMLKQDIGVMFNVLTKNSEMYAGTAIKTWLKEDPEVLINTLIASKRPKTILKAMGYLNEEQKAQVAKHFLGGIQEGQGLITKSTTRVGSFNKVDGGKLLDSIDQFIDGNTAGMMEAFLGKGRVKTLKDLGQEMAEIAGEEGSKAGSTAIFLAGPGAVRSILSGSTLLGLGAVGAGGYAASGDDPMTGIITVVGGLTILMGPRSLANFLLDRDVGLRLIKGARAVGDNKIKLSTYLKSFVSQMSARGFDMLLVEEEEQGMAQALSVGVESARIGGARTNL